MKLLIFALFTYLSAVDIDALIASMTIAEKCGQLNAMGEVYQNNETVITSGEIGVALGPRGVNATRYYQELAMQSRLKIPLMFGWDVIHGAMTTFPVPLAMSMSWNSSTFYVCGRVSAVEATAEGICWTFAPMSDVSRDARWGRIVESGGEDPFLTGRCVADMVRGFQGENLADPRTMMACVKHYCIYGAVESGQDYNLVDVSLDTMFNGYLLSYKMAIEAGAGSIMTAFMDVNGEPVTASRFLLTEILREKWGFTGFAVSDYNTTHQMVPQGFADLDQATVDALHAGLDMDMASKVYWLKLPDLIRSGRASMSELDQAVRNVLKAKQDLGLFDDPFLYCDETRANEILTPENKKAARDVAVQTFVLLKNDHNILPLKKSANILVTGPLAPAKDNMQGSWAYNPSTDDNIDLLAAMKEVAAANGGTVKYVRGCNLEHNITIEDHLMIWNRIPRDLRTEEEMINEAVAAAENCDVIVFAGGEAAHSSGESSSRATVDVPETQRKLLAALVATGKPLAFVLFNGRPLELTWEHEHVPAILDVFFPGTEAGHAICDVLFGDVSPSGRLSATFPRTTGQLPLYYNHKQAHRPGADERWYSKYTCYYMDVPNSPLYPFGYGLSYTTFSYSTPAISSKMMVMGRNQTATVSVNVTNTGRVAAKETVQFYLRDLLARPTRPVLELKDFKQVVLAPGQTATVTFAVTEETLKFYDQNLDYVAQPGEFVFYVGRNSADLAALEFVLV